jgi:hypothetical protein
MTYILAWSLVSMVIIIIIIMGAGFSLYIYMRVLRSGKIATD